MDSWVYIFSRFTQEALVFEALLIFVGFAAYSAFYITHRRKFGVAGREVPSNLVKAYLAQLVADAEDMRTQLFGLLGKGSAEGRLFNIQISPEASPSQSQASAAAHAPISGATAAGEAQWVKSPETPAAPTVVNADPELQLRLKELESKMHEQAKALDAVLNEKMRLEEELAVARKKVTQNTPAGAQPDAALAERVKTLESQLAEYAVIEDDLANLKRLQKENKQLRTQLETLQPAASSSEEVAAANAPAEELTTQADSSPASQDAPAEERTTQSDSSPTPQDAFAEAAAATQASFEGVAATGTETPTEPSSAAPSEPAAEVTASTPVEEPAITAEASPADTPAPALEAASAEASSLTPPESETLSASVTAPTDTGFDALVDQVEKSLAPSEPQSQTEEKKAEGPATNEKTEEELQADFEQMVRRP